MQEAYNISPVAPLGLDASGIPQAWTLLLPVILTTIPNRADAFQSLSFLVFL